MKQIIFENPIKPFYPFCGGDGKYYLYDKETELQADYGNLTLQDENNNVIKPALRFFTMTPKNGIEVKLLFLTIGNMDFIEQFFEDSFSEISQKVETLRKEYQVLKNTKYKELTPFLKEKGILTYDYIDDEGFIQFLIQESGGIGLSFTPTISFIKKYGISIVEKMIYSYEPKILTDQLKLEYFIKYSDQKKQQLENLLSELNSQDEKSTNQRHTAEIKKNKPTAKVTKSEKKDTPPPIEDYFYSISGYRQILKILIDNGFISEVTFVFIDSKKGSKTLFVAILKSLHQKGYLKKSFTHKDLHYYCKTVFKISEISLVTVQKAKVSELPNGSFDGIYYPELVPFYTLNTNSSI